MVQSAKSSKKPVRIALSGYYGCGNTGDEAVLAGIVESFAKRAGAGAAEFTVLSQDPEDTKKRHGLNAVPRMNAQAVHKAIVESDLLISGGGSLLQDVTSLRSLLYYQWVIHRALQLKRPVMMYAQGIGPLRRSISRVLVRIAANRLQQITVRDEESAQLLKKIGVRKTPIEVTADPAFALQSAGSETAREILSEAGAPEGKRLVGVALRPWGKGPYSEAYAISMSELAANPDSHFVFIPMQPPGDVVIAEEVAGRLKAPSTIVRGPLTPQEAVAVVGELDLLIGMRLHALIFGAMGAVPMVALSYDPKVSQLMRRIGQGNSVVEMSPFSVESISSEISRAWEADGAMRVRLRQCATEMADLALVNVDRAIALAG